jgi:hypothetical protein
MALPAHSGPRPLIQFRNHFFTDGRTPWTSDQPVARLLPKHRTSQTQNKRTQSSMPLVGFEPTIPASEWAKTVHALDCATTVTGFPSLYVLRKISCLVKIRIDSTLLLLLLLLHYIVIVTNTYMYNLYYSIIYWDLSLFSSVFTF